MGNLSNLYISQSFQSLAHLGTNNALVPGTMTQLEDGIGQSLNISFDGTNISSSGNIFAANLTGSASTGSFMLTGSVSVNVLTFTKADGSTFDLTVAASGSVVPGTISGSAQITALGFVSSSVTASSLITASFDNGTRNLTFTKGNNTTFNVNIPDVSGSTINTGSFVTTSSFNAYTSSTNNRLNNLESTSASVNVSISNLNSTTASQATSITNLNSATQSLFSSASLSLTTASFSGNTLTFTKGNGTTFGVVIPDVSGSGATPTGSLLVTASAFINTITFTKGDGTTFPVTVTTGSLNYVTGSFGAFYDTTTQSGSAGVAYSMKLNNTDISDGVIISGSGGIKVLAAGTYDLQFSAQVLAATGADTVWIWLKKNGTNVADTSTKLVLRNNEADVAAWNFVVAANANDVFELAWQSLGGHTLLFAEAAASNYTAIPSVIATMNRVDVGGGTNLVSTASFNSYTSSTNTRLTNIESTTASLNTSASLALVTASFDNGTRNLTFTKGNTTTFAINIPAASGSTIDTGSFATTGSNTFNGNQIISGTITTTQDITVSSVKFGFGNPAGTSSIAIGNSNTLQNNTDDNNIAIGNAALQQNTTGERNIGIGTEALKNITGNSSYNTAIGGYALSSATSSTNTFALGYAAMEFAETSNENVAIGVAALYRKKANSNTNVAIGSDALRNHYDGDSNGGKNMAIGYAAMQNVTSGSANTAIGEAAMRDPARANENVFIGWIAGFNASGSIANNVVIGARAGQKLANSSNTIIGHNAGSELVNGGANTFIGQGAGAAIVTGSSNTLIGSSLLGVDNWNNVIAISDGAGAIKTKFQSDIWEFTGSVDIQNSLTASLQQGYVWVGNSAGRTVTVATSSFGGGGSINTGSFATTGSNTFTGDQTLIDNAGNSITISDASGSLMLVAKGFTSASAHMSASAAGIGNFIFKTNSNTADTIISGSNNIFTNQTAPTAGFKRYIGGSNNIINSTSGPQRSGSMEFSPGFNGNYYVGTMNMRGPVSSSAWNINNNIIQGTISVGSTAANHGQGIVSGLSMTGNLTTGTTLNIVANRTNLSQSLSVTNNVLAGVATTVLNAASSSFLYTNNIGSISALNSVIYSSVADTVDTNALYIANNQFAGIGNNITGSGIYDTNDTSGASYQRAVEANIIGGINNRIDLSLTPTGSNSLSATALIGLNLIITGSSKQYIIDGVGANAGGSAFFGRYNAQDGNRAQSAQTVFAVGTGTSTSLRKTGFLIDSGSNTFVEGTFNVSGSTSLNGNLIITGSLTASLQQGFVYVGNASGITTTVATSSFISTINTGSFATTGSNSFNGNQTITGSVTISGSLTTAGNMFQVTGSFNTFGNVITQEGVFTSSLAGGLYIDNIGYVGSGSAGAFFINSTTQDIKIQNYYTSDGTTGKNIVIENFSPTGSTQGIHGKVALRARGTGGAVTVENTSQFRVECQTEITGSLIVSGSLAAANNIKMGRGTDKPTNKVTVGSGGLIVSNSLVTADSYIFATNDTTVGNYSPVVSNITAGSFSLSNGGYGGNISVMYMIVNPY